MRAMWAGVMLLLGAASVGAQSAGEPGAVLTGPPISVRPMGMPHYIPRRQMIAMNEARQKKIVADSEQLLALALEVKSQVQQAGAGMEPPDVAKKMAEIEKLAHDVKSKETE